MVMVKKLRPPLVTNLHLRRQHHPCVLETTTAASDIVTGSDDDEPPSSVHDGLIAEIDLLKQKLAEKDKRISELEVQLTRKNRKIDEHTVQELSNKFSYDRISSDTAKFRYLTGLTVDQFRVLMDCIRPYIDCMVYGDNKRPTEKSFSYETQYLIVMMICRHGLDLKFAAFVTNVSETTIGRIFNSWVVFLSTLFNKLDTRPDQKFLLQKMPDAFINTGHGMTDLILDATEFKFQSASNFDLSSLMFSHYKNTTLERPLLVYQHMEWVLYLVMSTLVQYRIPILLQRQAC